MGDIYDEDHRNLMAHRNKERNATARDIGDIPECANPERRDACRNDFKLFCETYYPLIYYFGWSNDHLEAIERIEKAVIEGEMFALAMPRGQGKTTMSETACQWAILYGHRRYVVLIGATQHESDKMLESIRTDFESNEELIADHPMALWPIKKLERVSQRAKGQTYHGKATHIGWKGSEMVMPTIDGSPCSGSVVVANGLTGAIRGKKHKTASGESLRPDSVVVDDPQTDESALSVQQCNDRERLLMGAVRGLAGPGKRMAGIMPCTIITPGDLADRMLDRKRHPEWHGKTTSLLRTLPINISDEDAKKNGSPASWDAYGQIRDEAMREDRSPQAANDYYVKHREWLDEGAESSWPERFDEGDISAIQFAMNIYLTSKEVFFAEYQNQPMAREESVVKLKAQEVATRVNGHDRLIVPTWAHTVTAMIDVQQDALYYCVAAWGDGFGGAVIDYGTWPEQPTRNFTLKTVRRTIKDSTGEATLDSMLYKALGKLVGDLAGARYVGDDGSQHAISRLLIDANWGESTDCVYQFCRQSPHSSLVTPSHGRGITASNVPLNDTKRKKGEKMGHYWRVPPAKGARGHIRHVMYDTNYWKSFIANGLSCAIGGHGAIMLYQGDHHHHQNFSEHMVAEYSVRTQGRGREVDEWKVKPQRPDNHWFDCLVGCAVGASMEGIGTHRKAPTMVAPRQAPRQTRRSAQTAVAQSRQRNTGGGFMDGFSF